MRTILITGCDTGVGKTWVTGALAFVLKELGQSVQIVKPVETGVAVGGANDAPAAARAAGGGDITAHTLKSYGNGIAPVAAAVAEGETLTIDGLVEGVSNLSPLANWRLVEGAGGIAVPLQVDGADWTTFARKLDVYLTVIVVETRLGAINQARMSYAYAQAAGLRSQVWLNQVRGQDARVLESTRRGVLECGLPLFGETALGQRVPRIHNSELIR